MCPRVSSKDVSSQFCPQSDNPDMSPPSYPRHLAHLEKFPFILGPLWSFATYCIRGYISHASSHQNGSFPTLPLASLTSMNFCRFILGILLPRVISSLLYLCLFPHGVSCNRFMDHFQYKVPVFQEFQISQDFRQSILTLFNV